MLHADLPTLYGRRAILAAQLAALDNEITRTLNAQPWIETIVLADRVIQVYRDGEGQVIDTEVKPLAAVVFAKPKPTRFAKPCKGGELCDCDDCSFERSHTPPSKAPVAAHAAS